MNKIPICAVNFGNLGIILADRRKPTPTTHISSNNMENLS
jgi:hypothetical protein